MALRLNGSTSGYVELNAPAVAGSTSLTVPFGVIQVVQATTASKISSTTVRTDHDCMSASITPKVSNSNILVSLDFGVGDGNNESYYLKRGSTKIGGSGVTNSNFIEDTSWLSTDENNNNTYGISPWSWQYLDTGRTAGTSQITYTFGAFIVNTGSGAFYFNRADNDQSGTGTAFRSTMTLWEVAA